MALRKIRVKKLFKHKFKENHRRPGEYILKMCKHLYVNNSKSTGVKEYFMVNMKNNVKILNKLIKEIFKQVLRN